MKNMYVYILVCSDKSYYIDVTNNLESRFEQHMQGININCYTYKRRPIKLAYYELFNDPKLAIAFEKKLKGWTREKKKALIEKNWNKLKNLSACKNETHFTNTNSKLKVFDSAQTDQHLL